MGLSMQRTDRQVVESFFAAQRAKDLDTVLACWCEDGVMKTPYAPPPMPREYRGLGALRRMFTALFAGAASIELHSLSLLATEEPGLWLANWSSTITLHNGTVFSGQDIGTLRVRDGRIAEYVEYFDAIACAKSYGLPTT